MRPEVKGGKQEEDYRKWWEETRKDETCEKQLKKEDETERKAKGDGGMGGNRKGKWL